MKTAPGGNVHAYPFNENNPNGPKRSKSEFLENVKHAIERNEIVNGIKGISWFAALPSYDIIDGTGIDYMHGVLGYMKQLLHLWFDSTYSKDKFSVSKQTKIVDAQMNTISTTNSISHCPRPISDLKNWKASEFSAFVLFYGPVVLRSVLPFVYFQNFFVFV